MHSTATPPAWADAILYLLLPAGRAETVSGDLLEQYRDEKYPLLGPMGADFWYVRQVAALFMRKYAALALVPIVFFIGSDLLNTFRNPAGSRYLERPEIGWLIGAAFATAFSLAGFLGGWSSRRVRGGLAVALGTFLVVWSFAASWWMTTFYPFSRVQNVNPYWIAAWEYSRSPGETFVHWIFWDNIGATVMMGGVLALLSIVLGSIGGLIGRLAAARRPASNPDNP